MLAEQAFLWWNYYIIHLHQLSQGISLSLHLSTYHDSATDQQTKYKLSCGLVVEKEVFLLCRLTIKSNFHLSSESCLSQYFSFSNFLRHWCSNSRKISPSINSIELHKETGHTSRIRLRGPHTAKYETEAISATLNRNSWDNQRHYLTIMCWKFHENCTKTKHRLTRCEKRKQKTEQREWERERAETLLN